MLHFGTEPRYILCVRSLDCGQSLPNINKINVFFSDISRQIHNSYGKIAITHINLAQSQMLFHMHQ